MSQTEANTIELTDPELISRVREGDVDAFGTLFSRHVDAATRLARLLVGASDADDLVSESFVKVLNVLLGGGGPDVAFRAYLLTAVRRLHIDKVRGQQRLTTTGDMTPYDPGVPFTDTAVAGFEGGAAAKAFASLPERWQMVLWHLEVENQKPADIAPLLGMSANSVSALAYRAREGLRQAFLNMHSGDLVSEACRETNELMGGYVRQALSRRDTARVEDHLDHCRRCTAVYLELAEVNSSLAGLLGPALLGAAAAAYLGGGAVTGVGAGTGVLALVGRARDAAMANLPATAAATVTAVGVATITAIAIINQGPSERPAAAEPPGAGIVPSSTPTPSTESGSASDSQAPTGRATQPASPGADATDSPDDTATDTAAGALDLDAAAGDGTGDGTGDGNGGDGGDGPDAGPGKPGSGTNPGSPKPGPSSNPKPSTPPPTSPPPSSPPPSSPPPQIVNVGVQASVTYDRHGHLYVSVKVTSEPPGPPARLTATVSTGDLHSHNGGDCQRSGARSYTCTATPADSWFRFSTHSQSRPTVTFRVSPPSGWTDPSLGNNSVTVQGRRAVPTG